MADALPPFAGLLRGLRTEAGLTQEELADAAGLTARAISYLERGQVATPRKATVRLLADVLHLAGRARVEFEASARGRGTVISDVAAPDGTAVAATRALPRDVASFTGRERELADLAQSAARAGAAVSIHAIGGMAGIGKTAFAVHAAHQLAGHFPAGQVFLPLHGHTPGQQPTRPSDALASLLATLGVAAAQIPASLEARTALWRSQAARRRLLLILDDAISSEQVAPLIPGSGRSLVLITSRRHLSALHDATAISLDTLPPDEAAVLLTRLTGRSELAPEDAGVGDLIQLCGFLPLAIGMVARQLRHHPAWTPAARAADLAAAANRVDALATENLSVAAALDLSYADLSGNQQRLFRRLGLHPGSDIDAYAAAALDGVDLEGARRGLEDLYDHHLLTEPAPGRYRLHDLIREHARTLVRILDTGEDREQATERLLGYYQAAATQANALLVRDDQATRTAQKTGQPTPALASREQAFAWLRAERATLFACLDYATDTGHERHIIALTAGVASLMRIDGPWPEAIARHVTAVRAARSRRDYAALASILNELGDVRQLVSDCKAAVRDLEQALSLFREIGDSRGQASALTNLGKSRQDDYPTAVRDLEEALSIARESSDRRGQALALSCLGRVHQMTGDFQNAARQLEQALDLHRAIGDLPFHAYALIDLGRVITRMGNYTVAVGYLQEGVSVARGIGDRRGQAGALIFLGDLRRRMGDHRAAVESLIEGVSISRDIGYRVGQANALLYLGIVSRLNRDLTTAARHLQEALELSREIGYRGCEATALNEQATLHRVAGQLTLARQCHAQALQLAHEIGSAQDEAHALAGLGRCALAVGRPSEAADGLRQALEIFRRIGSVDTVEVAAELNALSRQ